MEYTGQDGHSERKRGAAAARSVLSSLRAALAIAVKLPFAARSDLSDLTEAQLRDAGIDPGEVERIRALRRPLIR